MYICGDNLDDILMKLYKKLQGKANISPSKGKASEITGVLIRMKNPRARLSRTEGRGKVFSALGELFWYMSGRNDLSFIRYYIPMYDKFSDDNKTIYGGYGPRIFGPNGQFDRVMSLLAEKKDSRQAIIQIFDAEDLKEKHNDIPCTCTLQFLLRRDKLSLIVHMRSNDVFLGLPHDIFSFTMIQEYAAAKLECDIGDYKHFVGSLHLYDKNKPHATQYICEGWQDEYQMPPMPVTNIAPDLDVVLENEQKIRLGVDVNIDALSINTYWKDILYLLVYFHAKKHGKDDFVINSILEKIENEQYKIYIKSKGNTPTPSKVHCDKTYKNITKMLVDALYNSTLANTGVILDGSPIPAFGNISTAQVATLGLNPSNNEFFDDNGNELEGDERRFHTKKSLQINDWSDLNDQKLDLIMETCNSYFLRKPYDRWFRPLDNLLLKSGFSFYGVNGNACHLDLVPFATYEKWSALNVKEKKLLLSRTSSSLGAIIKNSTIGLLILNGRTIVEQLKFISDLELNETCVESLSLKRKTGKNIHGYEYTGKLTHISGIDIGRTIYIYGFNHNIQSSFGVTNKVKDEISNRLCNYLGVLKNEGK